MYYGGMSLKAIRKHLDQQYGNKPSDSTIYDWVTRFTKVAVNKTREYKPEVGDVWVVDENVLKVGDYDVWCWDIIDTDTKFLVASHMSLTRTIRDVHGWWFPEKPGPEHGCFESNIDVVISADAPREEICGSVPTRGTLCRVYK